MGRMTSWVVVGVVGMGLGLPAVGWGAEAGSMEGPAVSADPSWAGYVAGAIACLFGLAWVVGPMVRRNAPEEVPPAHSHDEPPGASGHHGRGGTVDVQPRDNGAHGHH